MGKSVPPPDNWTRCIGIATEHIKKGNLLINTGNHWRPIRLDKGEKHTGVALCDATPEQPIEVATTRNVFEDCHFVATDEKNVIRITKGKEPSE